jgi:phage terminase small subunit
MEIIRTISASLLDEPSWMDDIDSWDQNKFLASSKAFLMEKNKVIDAADRQLLAILATQIGLYVSSIKAINAEGAVIAYNKGLTLGPNPHVTIADKTLNRIIQLMKELELTPKGKNGFKSNLEYTEEYLAFIAGPKSFKNLRTDEVN